MYMFIWGPYKLSGYQAIRLPDSPIALQLYVALRVHAIRLSGCWCVCLCKPIRKMVLSGNCLRICGMASVAIRKLAVASFEIRLPTK